ncbi:MAG: hypothetical protein WA604_11850 [Candidatus Sulfotelmatobacter sp.]
MMMIDDYDLHANRRAWRSSGMEAVCEKCTLRWGTLITGDANLDEKDLPSFDFTRSGRLGVCELMVERRQELRFFDSFEKSWILNPCAFDHDEPPRRALPSPEFKTGLQI